MDKTIELNDGRRMPRFGLGVFLVSDVAVCERSVRAALDSGYRLIDTAALYRNERAVGRAVRASGVPRDDVFLTTKLWPSDYGAKRVRGAIDAAVERLDCGPLDLLLLHQPVGDVRGAWRAMEEAVDRGLVRSIGVSNFTAGDLDALLPSTRIRPAVDQIELHPYWQQPDLLPALERHGIVPEAWYPLGHGSSELLAEPAVTTAAAAHGVSPAQIVLRWHLQRGWVVIPKSTDPAHIAANIDLDGFELSPQEMAAIDALGRTRPLQRVPRWAMSLARFLRPRALP